MSHVLTADLGNSVLKLRLFRLTEEARFVSAALVRGIELERASPGFDFRARTWLADLPAVERIALSSVATAEDTGLVLEALAGAGPGAPGAPGASGGSVEVLVAPDAGLENRCRAPARVGRDRLYAARAALELAGGAAIVLDCGTALTVDAVAPAASTADSDGARGAFPRGAFPRGAFLGGAIAPGPARLARALEGAAQLFAVEPDPGAPALGRDTRAALVAGVVHGLRGAAARLAREIALEAGFGAHALVVTGGAAGLLLGGSRTPEFDGALAVPDLVHHGLLLAVGIAPPRLHASARHDGPFAPGDASRGEAAGRADAAEGS